MKTINLETTARFNEILTTSTGRAPAPTRHCFLLIPLVIVCLWTSPKAQAVVPPPDGGYPGGNTAEGYLALGSLTTGAYNTAVGIYSVLSLTDGNFCTGIGAGALLANTADENTATGAGALLSNSSGADNTANGTFALFSNTEGTENTAIGARALFSSTTGLGNTAIGATALFSNTSGGNTAVGATALQSNTTGRNNIALGLGAGGGVTTADNVVCIGSFGTNESNSCFIGQIFGATSSGGTAVFINSSGRLGTVTSSRRFKEEIKPIQGASEVLFALKPVTFRYNKEIDPQGTPQLGLVAEDVEKVNPDLVVRDKEGKPYSVRYDQVNAMLLNEFLKEHRKNEEQEATILRQQKQIDALIAGLEKVSAQLELSKPPSQMVLGNH